jgi:hypothetical protein
MQRWQGRIASSTNQIWPCLSPFMFRSVLEIMLGTEGILRWRGLMIRKMLGKFSPQLADYPLEHGFPAAPASWKNFYRFFPLAGYFTRKVTAKVAGRLVRPPKGESDGHIPPRLQLWQDERVKELLDASQMKLCKWMDFDPLQDFLRRSQRNSFSHGQQWARILSLECALQAAERASSEFRD